MIKQFNANRARLKRHLRMRSHMEGSQERPRLSVFRSGHHIYAQIIDDTTGQTLAAASSRDYSSSIKTDAGTQRVSSSANGFKEERIEVGKGKSARPSARKIR
jgi:ribosomal protein L18